MPAQYYPIPSKIAELPLNFDLQVRDYHRKGDKPFIYHDFLCNVIIESLMKIKRSWVKRIFF